MLAKHHIFAFLGLLAASSFLLLPAIANEPDAIKRAKGHLYFLASDSLKGRNTPSPELDKAANYIANQFSNYGLLPINGSYFHNYKLQRSRLGNNLTLRIKTPSHETTYIPKDDYVPFENTGSGELRNTAIAFVGYGIQIPELHYDDYNGIDVRGKVVVFFRGVPNFSDSILKDSALRRQIWQYSLYSAKARTALRHGAVGCLVVNVSLLSNSILPKPSGFPWPSLFPKMSEDALPLQLASKSSDSLIPFISIGENIISALFGSLSTLTEIQTRIVKSGQPQSFPIDSVSASELTVNLQTDNITAKNVVGIIKGSDTTNDYVIIGAHYDHVGWLHAKAPNTDTVFNGADDNASGTTGLLLLAEQFAQSNPKRSIVFIAFSGEEKGLFGSKAYCDSPLLPLKECKAMFNLDMIGRNSDDSLSLGGNTRCKELADIAEEENKELKHPFKIAYNIESFFFRSDQASFAMNKIPVLFFFTGEHADYHGLGDEADKINFPKLLRVAELCGKCVWRIANSSIVLPYLPQKADPLQ